MLQQSGFGIAVTGSGSCTPQVSLDNNGLSQIVETNDEWIGARTGIRSRRLADDRTSLCDLASEASLQAIAMAEISPTDIDLIILATSSPDDLFGTASKIQYQLGATKAVAFDLTAACSGFIFGLVTASQFIRTGVYQNVLLIGADILSRWVNWSIGVLAFYLETVQVRWYCKLQKSIPFWDLKFAATAPKIRLSIWLTKPSQKN